MAKAFYNLDDVRGISILDVCEAYGVLVQRQGKSYFCKIRNEKTASCKLNLNTRFGYDTFKDFGSNAYGDVIAFVQEVCGFKEWQEALEDLAQKFNIQPQNNTEYMQRNELTDREYGKIGIYGDLATKNFDFDLDTFTLESAEKYAQKYAMSVNELRQKHPNKYLYDVIMKRAFPYIHKMRHDYYFSLYTGLSFQKEIFGHFDINNVPQEDLDRYKQLCHDLIQAESLLKKALKGTGYEYPFKTYDVRSDLQKIYKGEIPIEIGVNSYADIKQEVSVQGVYQRYRSVSLDDYLTLKEYDIDSVKHAAFLKNDKVNLVFMPENELLIEELILKKDVDRLKSACVDVLRENYGINISSNEVTADGDRGKGLTHHFLTVLSKQLQELPKSTSFSVEALGLDANDITADNDKLTDALSERLNEEFGFDNRGFEFEVVYSELGEPSAVAVSGIVWTPVLSESEIALYSQAALFHDVGKFLVDESILNKPGRLTAEEYEVIKTHPSLGLEIFEKVKGCDERLLSAAKLAAGMHHERVDGCGYPSGCAGKDIPVFVQAIALADVYDALRSERPYKKSLKHVEAVNMIKSGKCGAFHKNILKCLDKYNPLLMSKHVYPNKYGIENDVSKAQDNALASRER